MRSRVSRWVLGGVGVVLLPGLLWALLPSPSKRAPAAASTVRSPPSPSHAQALSSSAAHAPVLPLHASGPLTLGGQVLGPDGPVAGAIVLALPSPSANWSSFELSAEHTEDPCVSGAATARFLERVDALQRDATPLAQTTTDAQGRFLLEGLGPEPFVLWAEQGLLLGVHEGVSAAGPEVRVRLAPGAWLTSQVLDEEGLPLEGVRVTVPVHAAGRILDTTTDGEGRFVLGPVPDREEPIVLSKPGFLSANFSLRDPLLGVARLSTPHRLSGRVLDERGPVAGATVRLEHESRADTVTTDGQGRFALDDLCASPYVLVARRTGLIARRWVDVVPGQVGTAVDLLLAPALRLSGQVTDASGQGLPNAGVEASSGEEPPQLLETKTDSRGGFVLEPLTPGPYVLKAQATGHVPQQLTRLVNASQELTFTLKPAESLEGSVVDERGAPVQGAELRLMSLQGWSPDPSPTTSDARGHFLLEAPEARAWRVKASHPDFASEDVTFSVPARDIRLVLRRGASVEARVVDEEGRPLEFADVSLMSAEKQARLQREHTDEAGKAVFHHLRPGDYTVQTCSTDPSPRSSAKLALADQESRTVHLSSPREGRLTGHVVDALGRPVTGATLSLTLASSLPMGCARFAELQSGAKGYFSVSLTPGTWTLRAVTPERVLDAEASRGVQPEKANLTEHDVALRVLISSAATQVQLVLRPPRGRIRGRVVHEDGRPVVPFQLNGREVLHAEGRFEVPLQDEALRIEAPGLAPFIKLVPALLPPKDIELGEVVLRPLSTVEGTVVDALSSAPITGALVRVQDQEEEELSRQSPMAYTGPGGRFTLEGVRPTDTSLGIKHPLYPPMDVSFTPGQRVRVRLVPGATLEGRVESGGVPMDTGTVELRTPQGDFAAFTELTQGHYALERLPAGRYTVRVQGSPEDGSALLFPERTVTLAAREHTVLDFVGDHSGVSVEVRVPEQNIDVYLVPGDIPPCDSFRKLVIHLLEGFTGKPMSDTVRRFRPLPGGSYSLVAVREDATRAVHQERVQLPAEGKLTVTLAPRWKSCD